MAGTASQQEQVTRLTDMDVQEVSIVDRAANKRRLLVVKREGSTDMATQAQGTEVVSDGKGGLTTQGTAPTAPAPAAPVAKGDAAPAAPAAPAPAAPVTPDFEALAKAAGDLIAAVRAEAQPVEKKGAKIKTARLAKLRDMHKALGELIAELEPEAAAEAAPSAGVAQADVAKAASTPVPAAPVAPAEPAADSDAVRLAKAVEDLTGIVKAQGDVIQAQGQRLAALGGTAATSAVIPVEKGAGGGKGGGPAKRSVSWPRDMNHPVDKEHTAADVSFHDP